MTRLILAAAASVWILASCAKPEEPAPEPSPESAAAHPGHAAMDETMAAADKADDVSSLATPDGYTFHTYPKKIEIVRVPLDGQGVWSAHGYAEADYFRMVDSRDEQLAGGKVHAIRFEMLASGNGKVVFEKRATANPGDPVLEARSFSFMIH
jgi:hypothetical protein